MAETDLTREGRAVERRLASALDLAGNVGLFWQLELADPNTITAIAGRIFELDQTYDPAKLSYATRLRSRLRTIDEMMGNFHVLQLLVRDDAPAWGEIVGDLENLEP